MRVLDYAVPYFAGLDGLRWLAVLLSALLAFAVGARWHLREHRGVYLALLLYAALGTVQELEQMGRPMLVWRLPLVLLAAGAGVTEILPRMAGEWRR